MSTNLPFSQLHADLFQVFASHQAQTSGITFDRDMTARWAEALREMASYARALELSHAALTEQVKAQQLLAFAKTGAPRPIPDASNIIDISEILQRERAMRRQPQTEGASA